MSVTFSGGVVFADIESHGVGELDTMPPEKFFRLGQWAIDEGQVRTTTDLDEFREVLLGARMVVFANGIAFDIPAVFGDRWAAVRLAREGKLLDTHVFAMIANPPPFGTFQPYTGGKPLACSKPEHFRKWIKLDQQAYSLGVIQKTGDINDIADRFAYHDEPVLTPKGKQAMSKGKPRMRKVANEGDFCCKYSLIPLDDPQFVEYAERDVIVVREVARKQLERHAWTPYARTEMLKAALATLIGHGNGFRADVELARKRVEAQRAEALGVLTWLRDVHGFPFEPEDFDSE